MSMFTEAQAREICEKVVKLSKADECVANFNGGTQGNIRFALNQVSTSGIVEDANLAVQVAFGKRVGIATTNVFDDASLVAVVRRAEELAKLAPENPEFMPAIGKQKYVAAKIDAKATAEITPEYRAQVAADSIGPCKAQNLVAAGFFTDNHQFAATANSKGNFGYQTTTGVDFTCTVRTADERGSGWVSRNLTDVSQFDAKKDVAVAIDKSKKSVDAKALEPGKYTVILEPAAASGLIAFMMFGFDARQADEGRSFMSKKGGGNRIGEKVFDERVSLHADPTFAEAPTLPWDQNGLARARVPIVTKGVVDYLYYERFWAKEKGKPEIAQPGNIIMAGGDKTTADLVKSTKRGILVTRTWYIRLVDPQTMLLTGLTRDGTFYVEDGEVKYPIKNFRFNESPVIMLNNIEELGKPERVDALGGVGGNGFVMMVPPMKIRDFTFTSLSDAV